MATKIDPYSIGFAYNDLAVEITPEEAAALLELNVEGNRDLREPAVDRLVADIEAGTYLPSGSTIGISESGQLIDGQHRLTACVRADKPIRAIVVRGLPDESYVVTDKGTRRSFADTLKYMGETSWTVLATLTARMVAWDAGDTSGESYAGRRFTESERLAYFTENRDELRATITACPTIPAMVGIRGSVAHLVLALTRRVDPDEAVEFMRQVATGNTPSHTIASTREQLLRDYARPHGDRRSDYWRIGLLLRTWNAWRDGDEKKIVFNPGGARSNTIPAELH